MNTDFLNQLRAAQQASGYGGTNYGSASTPNVDLFGGGANTAEYMKHLYKTYNGAREARGDSPIEYDDFVNKTNDFIGQMGVAEGKWTEDEYNNKSYNQNAFNSYANAMMPALLGYDINARDAFSALNGYSEGLDDKTKAAYDRYNTHGNQNWTDQALEERMVDRFSDDTNFADYAWDSLATVGDWVGSSASSLWNTPYNQGGNAKNDYATMSNYIKGRAESTADILDNYQDYIAKARDAQKMASSSDSGSSSSSSSNPTGSSFSDNVSEGDYVSFTYKPGDTFGQKIVDLGLNTENGLWGADGDVNFYTRQLIEQGALDANGNLKLGQTFKLRRRK